MTHSYGPSHFLQVDDARRLHYMVNGSGPLTVVFESGMGFSRSCWGLVQPLIAEHSRAVVYDRAGLGRSDADPRPRTLERLAGDLGALLDHLGPGPFILVGHSWGGPIVRAAAAANPTRIHGIVLVDPSDEHCDLYFTKNTRRSFRASAWLIPAMARMGLYRAMGARAGAVQPADVAADHRREDFGTAAAAGYVAEVTPFAEELFALREHPPQLGSIAVRLISGGRASRLERAQRNAIRAAHRQAVAQLENARIVEAEASGHLVMFDEPQLIVDEIVRMTKLDKQG